MWLAVATGLTHVVSRALCVDAVSLQQSDALLWPNRPCCVVLSHITPTQVSRLMGMGADENVADQIAGKLEDMLAVVRKVGRENGWGTQLLRAL